MKMRIAAATAACFVMLGGTALAGSVGTLNSFTANTSAVAADVNANFTAVETAVNDNNSRIGALEVAAPLPLRVFDNGVAVGYVVDTGNFITSTGYFINIQLVDGSMPGLKPAYTTSNCTGQAYMSWGLGSHDGFMAATGGVRLGADNALYAVAPGSTAASVTFGSVATGPATCNATTGSITGIPVSANNEVVTGFPNAGLTGPISFGF